MEGSEGKAGRYFPVETGTDPVRHPLLCPKRTYRLSQEWVHGEYLLTKRMRKVSYLLCARHEICCLSGA